MVIDTSALFAIVMDEPERHALHAAIEADPQRLLSAASLLEARIVLWRRAGEIAVRKFDDYLRRAGIEVAPVTVEDSDPAFDAFRRFGKGNHRAGLNFGDCFAYALAMSNGEPLLFKSADFAATDVTPVSF